MKLKNKKTGLGGRLAFRTTDCFKVVGQKGVVLGKYKTMAELCEEWEDYRKEPTGFWLIDIFGIVEYAHLECYEDGQITYLKRIGNYFETEEEAEKAVEELEALKRLKDYAAKRKGHLFDGWCVDTDSGLVKIYTTLFAPLDFNGQVRKDIHTIFGGLE